MEGKNKLVKITLLIILAVTIVGIVVFLIYSGDSFVEETETELQMLADVDQSRLITVREHTFVRQMDEINRNIDRYVGNYITLEGFVVIVTYGNDAIYGVGRNYAGCCGEEFSGVIIEYDGQMPEENDWVEILGVLEASSYFANTAVVRVREFVVKQERGLEFVTR